MKYARIFGAVVLTILMLYVARRNSVGSSEHFVHVDGAYQFEIETVPKGMEHSDTVIRVNVVGPFDYGHRVMMQVVPASGTPVSGAGYMVPFTPTERGSSEFYLRVPVGAKNEKTFYRIAVVDGSGGAIAQFSRPDGSPFVLRSIGHVPLPVLAGHILFIFGTFFCVAMAALCASPLIAGKMEVRPMAVWFAASAVCAFVGGYPFGFAMNWFAFGGIWEGAPFGTDATDNKTQILFVYLIFMTLATLGSLSRGKIGRDIFTPRALGVFGLVGFLLQMSIYLIPHSIQFSAGLTYAVGYGFIALMALVYIAGLIGARAKAAPIGDA
jgi:hypothetical protein